ncbi:hypothetical protein DMH02_028680 [Streptomyces sp. WAC 00631]|uniref:hypothetical protein n=1 Tax=Streptomyces sp. WAC 00631 TaxID=2203201 RepID=UPI001E3F2AF3|nr:hypothetical protein [Streptomyces sp. WAC 00631]MCC5037041.1 hypothetical protein [Streptomyces sp. WAC 00631]
MVYPQQVVSTSPACHDEAASQGGTMIQITLGRKKDIDPHIDPLQRSQIGWSDGLSDRQLHEMPAESG